MLGHEIKHEKYPPFAKVISFADCRTTWWFVRLQSALSLTVIVSRLSGLPKLAYAP
jgi:hypothetical protein